MIIEESDFKLIPISDSSPLFDLELLYTITPKKGEPRKEFKNAGYGISIEYALKKIIAFRISNKYPKDKIISLSNYIKLINYHYKQLRDLVSYNENKFIK